MMTTTTETPSTHPLRDALETAIEQLSDAEERWSETDAGSTEEAEAQAELDAAEQAVEAARAALLASDEPREYEMSDGDSWCGDVECRPSEIEAEFTSWIEGGSWGPNGVVEETIWINGAYRCELTGEHEHCSVTLDPEEPECEAGDDHDWQSPIDLVGGIKENPGVWGKGGGCVSHEVCVLCGCGRTTDSWAQDRSTGEQGLTSVSYEEGEYAADILPAQVTRVIDQIADTSGLCEQGDEAAAYLILAARGQDDVPSARIERVMSSLTGRQRDRLAGVVDFLERVYRAVPRGQEPRAVRLALRIAATDATERRIADAVLAVLS